MKAAAPRRRWVLALALLAAATGVAAEIIFVRGDQGSETGLRRCPDGLFLCGMRARCAASVYCGYRVS